MPFSFVVEADLKDQKQLVSKLTKEKSRVLKEKEEIDTSLQHKKSEETKLEKELELQEPAKKYQANFDEHHQLEKPVQQEKQKHLKKHEKLTQQLEKEVSFTEDTSSLFIPFKIPFQDNVTPLRTITGLKWPWGVAVCDDGHVIVTECSSNCVTILDNEGKKVKSLGGKGGSGNVQFSNPRGVAITPDNFILVSDHNHRIQKISMDGDCIASVGERGSGPLQFSTPEGIAISPITGQVYIADRYNHRIQVLNPDLTFSHSFGREGSANGQFKINTSTMRKEKIIT